MREGSSSEQELCQEPKRKYSNDLDKFLGQDMCVQQVEMDSLICYNKLKKSISSFLLFRSSFKRVRNIRSCIMERQERAS